jgi:hypothetical protein
LKPGVVDKAVLLMGSGGRPCLQQTLRRFGGDLKPERTLLTERTAVAEALCNLRKVYERLGRDR